MRRLEGRAAIVTGGASGIGASIARKLSAEGASVLVADVDLPTADFIANAGVEIDSGLATIVGQLQPASGTTDHFSLVLSKGNPLTPCVNAAVDALKADGTLDRLASVWLPFQESVPSLK